MQMGSLCALVFFWQALFVHGKPIFSIRQVTKNAKKDRTGNLVDAWKTNFLSKTGDKKCKKKIGRGIEPALSNSAVKASTSGPPPCTAMVLLRDHVETER